jgi:formylglycine-generating enzyme required for sulfatase activity
MKQFVVLLAVLASLFFYSCGRQESIRQESISLNLGDGVMLYLVLIHPGKFLMGTEDDMFKRNLVHKVTISQPFYLGKYEVTQAQWQVVMGSNPSYFEGATRPVECVSWDDCQSFIEKLNGKGLGTFRLPTEAEWEFACRAGTDGDFENPDEISWHSRNSDDMTHPVGRKEANPWGLYDMFGNVWEWCQDWYQDKLGSSPQVDPKGPASGLRRVARGCSYGDSISLMGRQGGIYFPYGLEPTSRSSLTGFRLVMSVQ